MKKEWICNWEIAPGDGEKQKTYLSYDQANTAIRTLLCESIDISDCVAELKHKGNFLYINAVAKFLTRYFSEPGFPYSADDIPSDNPLDYADHNEYPAEDEFFDAEDEYRLSFFYVNKCGFHYLTDGYDISSSFVLEKADIDDSFYNDGLEFSFERTTGHLSSGGANDMILHLKAGKVWGTSAYPLMVLKVLEDSDKPLMQTEIICRICKKYNVTMERKAVGRHLDMLHELGYKIQKSRNGFRIIK